MALDNDELDAFAQAADPRKVRLISDDMVHTPGLVNWLKLVYRTDPKWAANTLADTFSLPYRVAVQLLTGEIVYEVDDDNAVVFEYFI